ncbi:4-aminobutyrate--2-oxoglutarate transaminase [bacterium (Candidatus Blackallbacteria) CG17_big_fil_post_rev_8_21_14_2_50_48_46]|uniref:4-aminobutyrate--2-oxoglutarate transaminase n=1 Tax=bacterium (Candidatus Blackallbacteria) CG17_big_fil_post_rev_8_21_14_2_50_48_46 TaxID=2014261 RepID=A0A2M7G1Z7_9BACT|nr:MAG: 4-aminobutyrate--2-oxoglutarate transaminase [bacterium (Candidatus Blackallbacteria) CG18_big_fil_WC_8_21_14_2_50_49_26]PIW15772.1 MAG: 4-aminobutyrate--2-oxoglutarate transaminase [bacterium (Candidatus Blackallbacteria) CG17_big_fil_post_rev_8_21_14_2_50_48_46]PIW48730.1 MAG: 4-aminobutyrate--2-oxoglutarate transaminase [bacterium (Candidatus Blackallbacteria) CG13_big_fil_rev_8_21_14_2_50_49_14]
MSTPQDWIQRRETVMPRGVGQILNGSTVASAQGAQIITAEGRKLIDFTSGIGVTNTGHCPPEVVAAIQKQAENLMHACIHVATYEPYLNLCERLAAKFPHGEATKVFLTNTGAEAVENAVKIARQATGRPGIIAFSEGFHGRTLMALTLTSKVGYKLGCGPFAPEVYRLPYPNYFKYNDGLSSTAFVERELNRFRQALVAMVAPDQVAAVIIEPIQGEGGFVPAPTEYLQGLREICDQHGILLIFDEVQSGFGRAGDWSAHAISGVTPDLSTWAKAMGGGLPIACVIGKAKVMDACLPGTLGGTYGGNPIACAASLAVIDLMERDQLPERAARLGETIRTRFLSIQEKSTLVADVRGRGMMQALEFCYDRNPLRPAGEVVKKIMADCHDSGLLVISAGSEGNVIRTLPPLTISEADLNTALDILEREILKHSPD